jgi:hypothetical protein
MVGHSLIVPPYCAAPPQLVVCQNDEALLVSTGGVAMPSTEVERYSEGVDVADVPSAPWGWSRINHRTWHIVGLCAAALLLLMLDGNHVGRIENLYLIGFAALVLFFTVRDWWGRRRGWLR